MRSLTARALSIRQPWASLILAGHKPVENRTWAATYRGRVVVHAGKRPDLAVLPLPAEFGLLELPTGCYLGTADLRAVHHADDCGGCSPWAEPGVWHWQLTAPRPFAQQLPGPGRLGLYTPPPSVLAALVEEVT